MDDIGSDGASQLAEEIARVCAYAELYRGLLLKSGAAHLVDAVLAAARSSDTRDGRLETEALRDALHRAGHPGGLSEGRAAAPSVGIITMITRRRNERLFLCPLRRCSRYWFPADHAGEPVPICSAADLPLRERVL